MAASALGRDAEPSAGRVVVEVIVLVKLWGVEFRGGSISDDRVAL